MCRGVRLRCFIIFLITLIWGVAICNIVGYNNCQSPCANACRAHSKALFSGRKSNVLARVESEGNKMFYIVLLLHKILTENFNVYPPCQRFKVQSINRRFDLTKTMFLLD